MTSGRNGPARSEAGGLGNLFQGLGDFLSLVERLTEQGERLAEHGERLAERGERLGGQAGRQVSGEQEFTAPGGMRGVYGFSVRMGLGGTPTVERFGNVRATNAGPVVSETREPLIDVFDEGGEIVVVAEVPGVQEKDIHLDLTGDVLALSATGPKRKYEKEILLPAAVDPATLKQGYQNGYLELRYKKTGKG